MIHPASNPKRTEDMQSLIHRLPAEVRRAIALRATTSCLGDYAGPSPTTRADICVLDPGRSGFWLRPKTLRYSINLGRDSLHGLLTPFLELCKETRAAALDMELFAVSFEYHKSPKLGPTWHHRFIQNGPGLPLFSGAIKELVVSRISCAREANVLFFTLHHFFGANVQRIYLSQEEYLPREEEAEWVESPHTGQAYRTGACGSPLRNVESMLERFEDQPLGSRKGAIDISCEDGEFKEQDARSFITKLCSRFGHGVHTNHDTTDHLFVPFREVLRQHRDGRLMMNDGLKGGLEKRYDGKYNIGRFPREIFKQLVERGQIYFPDLEYISVCVRTHGST